MQSTMRRPLIERIAGKFIGKFPAGERTRDVTIGNRAEKEASQRGILKGRY
jgi:hypothetical protein